MEKRHRQQLEAFRRDGLLVIDLLVVEILVMSLIRDGLLMIDLLVVEILVMGLIRDGLLVIDLLVVEILVMGLIRDGLLVIDLLVVEILVMGLIRDGLLVIDLLVKEILVMGLIREQQVISTPTPKNRCQKYKDKNNGYRTSSGESNHIPKDYLNKKSISSKTELYWLWSSFIQCVFFWLRLHFYCNHNTMGVQCIHSSTTSHLH